MANKEGKKEGFLHPIPKEDLPLDTYHIDHLGPLVTTKKGYRYILTIVDAFSKFVWIYPVKSLTTAEVIQKMDIQKTNFGNPRRIITDRGPAFTGSAFQQYCQDEQIQHSKITTGVPRSNGQVERIHRIVLTLLTKLSLQCEDRWYKNVEKVQRWMNATQQRSIGTNPFKLMFGTNMRNKEDINIVQLLEEELLSVFQKERDEQRAMAAEQIQKVQEENRKTFNKKRKEATEYKIGDLVAIRRTQFGTGLKICPKYLGPYKVIAYKGNDRYDVEKIGDQEGPSKTSTAVDFMRPFTQFETDDEEEDSDENYEDTDATVNSSTDTSNCR